MSNNKKLLQSIENVMQEIRENQNKDNFYKDYFTLKNQKKEQKLK